jgi:hypothetical protein
MGKDARLEPGANQGATDRSEALKKPRKNILEMQISEIKILETKA